VTRSVAVPLAIWCSLYLRPPVGWCCPTCPAPPTELGRAHRIDPMILIVDDHPDTCRAMARLLERAGHQVACANDGPDALAHVLIVRPACVVLDVMMPDMDGFEVLKRLRAKPATSDVPVLMYSAHTSAADQRRARALGADDFAEKGRTGWADLLSRIDRLCERTTSGDEAGRSGPASHPT
jgi:CheY-like chemotaxis protein